ncbi:hypothetical protein CMV24_15795 [Pseudomonas plecoglossicida]|uniref:Uncharacterized protein n=1 Tax=Pseudomonas plecoglossicida TaxID=70775 RepID=A0A2A3M3D7_PSEDL|nr:hypothetical protein CMV24_15795 [Pseudomonas plecoglossicida]
MAAPAVYAAKLKSWGRFAPLSRHKAAPTGPRKDPGLRINARGRRSGSGLASGHGRCAGSSA